MTERNKGKLKAADVITELVQERLDKLDELDSNSTYQIVTRAAYETVLKDINVYQMIVTKSDRYGPVVDQQEPGCDY